HVLALERLREHGDEASAGAVHEQWLVDGVRQDQARLLPDLVAYGIDRGDLDVEPNMDGAAGSGVSLWRVRVCTARRESGGDRGGHDRHAEGSAFHVAGSFCVWSCCGRGTSEEGDPSPRRVRTTRTTRS